MGKNYSFSIVKRIINDWDPLYLLSSGAPYDAYESEVAQIFAAINKVNNYKDFSMEIQKIFEKAFNLQLSQEQCVPIANEIWSFLKSNN